MLIPIICILCGCNEAPTLKKEDILGKWVTKSIRVEIKTKDGLSEDDVFMIEEGEFEEEIGLKQNIGYFYADGTFYEEAIDLEDVANFTGRGIWRLEDDSLVVEIKEPQASKTKFGIKISGSRIEIAAYVDWDRDGDKDDLVKSISENVGDAGEPK